MPRTHHPRRLGNHIIEDRHAAPHCLCIQLHTGLRVRHANSSVSCAVLRGTNEPTATRPGAPDHGVAAHRDAEGGAFGHAGPHPHERGRGAIEKALSRRLCVQQAGHKQVEVPVLRRIHHDGLSHLAPGAAPRPRRPRHPRAAYPRRSAGCHSARTRPAVFSAIHAGRYEWVKPKVGSAADSVCAAGVRRVALPHPVHAVNRVSSRLEEAGRNHHPVIGAKGFGQDIRLIRKVPSQGRIAAADHDEIDAARFWAAFRRLPATSALI